MPKSQYGVFVTEHSRNYAAISKACVRHGVEVSLGESPNEIIVKGEMPKSFRDYMRKNQREFLVIKG